MALSYVTGIAGTGSSVSIPTHAVDDLMIGFAFRAGNSTPPTIPAGWTTISTGDDGNNNSHSVAYKLATSTSDSSGTWTNASQMSVVVYRDVETADPIGAFAFNFANTTSVTYGTVSMERSGDWIVGFGGIANSTQALETPPSGMTNRTTFSGGGREIAVHDTNGPVSSFSDAVTTIASANRWSTVTVEIRGILVPISGTVNVTEAADTTGGTGVIALKSTASITEAVDTLSGTGKVALKATVNVTEANDTSGGTAKIAIAATASITEAGDTLSSSAAVALKASDSTTEGNDTLSGTGALAVKATASITEATDTLTVLSYISGVLLEQTENPDTLSSTARLAVIGTLAATEADDTAISIGGEARYGLSGIIEADDNLGGTGALALAAYASNIEANDTFSITALLPVLAQLSIQEANDTYSIISDLEGGLVYAQEQDDAIGSSGHILIASNSNIAEGNDTSDGVAVLLITGTLAVSEGNDSSAFSGAQLISGTVTVDELDDIVNAQSILALRGPVTVTEQNDTGNIIGKVAIRATVNITEQTDATYASSFAGGLKFRWFNGTQFVTIPVLIYNEANEWTPVTLTGG